MSPTFCQSEDWVRYSSPRAEGHHEDESDARARAMERYMPSSNFSSRIRRMHSGRITANSDDWLACAEGEPDPKPAISNSETHLPSRGKRVNIGKDPDVVKGRLRQDPAQVEVARPRRRMDFPEQVQSHRNSDVVREHLRQPMVSCTTMASAPAPAAPVAYTVATVGVPILRATETRFYSLQPCVGCGTAASLPSTMPKDVAYLHGMQNAVLYGPRASGVFSPNVLRVPAAQALALG